MRSALKGGYAKQQTGYRKFVSTRRPVSRFLAAPMRSAFSDRLDLNAITNLALEGGGGKGCAYLGAIIALEELGKLPISPNVIGRIDKISGASAGAITAFLLALGLSARNIWEMTQQEEFLKFLDLPANRRARCATFQDDAGPKAKAEQHGGARIKTTNINIDLSNPSGLPFAVAKALLALAPARKKSGKQDGFGDRVGNFIVQLLSGTISKSKAKWDDHILEAVKRDPGGYLKNLFSDPGIFPGFAVRDFFARKLVDRMKQSDIYNDPKGPPPKDDDLLAKAKGMTFVDFQTLTKVNLIVAGTNLTTGKPAYFSNDTTPTFPVIEAVGISMSIPLVFKSVYLDTEDESYDDFRGWWGDGGVINNFPLHAFNKDQNGEQPALPHERSALPLNLATLGLTLEEPDLTQFGKPKESKPEFPWTLGMFGPLQDALLFSSTEGQIRSAVERQHTIRLNAYFLDTYDLAPDPFVVAATVWEARNKVYEAFQQPLPKSPDKMSGTYKSILKIIVDDFRKGTKSDLQTATTNQFAEKTMDAIRGDARLLRL
jgi:predicted acylesterase/phospholipase RssA